MTGPHAFQLREGRIYHDATLPGQALIFLGFRDDQAWFLLGETEVGFDLAEFERCIYPAGWMPSGPAFRTDHRGILQDIRIPGAPCWVFGVVDGLLWMSLQEGGRPVLGVGLWTFECFYRPIGEKWPAWEPAQACQEAQDRADIDLERFYMYSSAQKLEKKGMIEEAAKMRTDAAGLRVARAPLDVVRAEEWGERMPIRLEVGDPFLEELIERRILVRGKRERTGEIGPDGLERYGVWYDWAEDGRIKLARIAKNGW